MKSWEQPGLSSFFFLSAHRVKTADAGQSQKSYMDFQVRFDRSVWGLMETGYRLKDS